MQCRQITAVSPGSKAFVSYTEIFDPQDNRRRDGSFLDPVLGSSREIAIKGRRFDGRLNTALVLFDIRQDNVAEAEVGQTLPDGLTQAYVAVDGPAGPQRVDQASATLLSAMARYDANAQASSQLNASNLLDRKYCVLDEYSNLYCAAGRSAMLSFSDRF